MKKVIITIVTSIFCLTIHADNTPQKLSLHKHVLYEGGVQKGTPMGAGTLLVTKHRVNKKDLLWMDVERWGEVAKAWLYEGPFDLITGVFNNTTVTNGRISFSEGIRFSGNEPSLIVSNDYMFQGDFEYILTKERITYHLIRGKLLGYEINHPISISRDLRESSSKTSIFTITPNQLVLPQQKKYTGFMTNKTQEFPELHIPLYALASFANNAQSITEKSQDIITINNNSFHLEKRNNIILDFGNGISGRFTKQGSKWCLNIKNDNGDVFYIYAELEELISGGQVYYDYHNKDFCYELQIDVIHTIGNCVIEYHANPDDVRNHYDSDKEKTYIWSKLSNNFRERYSQIRYFATKRTKEDGWIKSRICMVNYSDGSKYYGFLYYKVNDYHYSRQDDDATELMVAGRATVPTTDDYAFGVYTTANGTQQLYVNGQTLDEIEQFDKMQMEQERIKKEEEKRREAEKYAEQARMAEEKKKEEDNKMQQLYNKYGKKYVDAVNNKTILIGTPESLILNELGGAKVKLISEGKQTRVYDVYAQSYFTNEWKPFCRVDVDISTRKVRHVFYY